MQKTKIGLNLGQKLFEKYGQKVQLREVECYFRRIVDKELSSRVVI